MVLSQFGLHEGDFEMCSPGRLEPGSECATESVFRRVTLPVATQHPAELVPAHGEAGSDRHRLLERPDGIGDASLGLELLCDGQPLERCVFRAGAVHAGIMASQQPAGRAGLDCARLP